MRNVPSQATELLDGYAPAAIWAQAVLQGGDAAGACLEYLRTWRHVRAEFNGSDLLAMGASQGQALGDVLRRLRAARLDGRVSTRGEEIEMARGLL